MSSDTIATETTAVAPHAAHRPALERVFDYLLGLSIASWAVLGVTTTPPSPVRWAITLLHVTVAYAIFRRAPRDRLGSPTDLVAAVPALVLAGLAFRLAAPASSWPVALEIVFLSGAALAMWTFLAMGESFSVLPAKRSIVRRGPYRFVRHPAYVGELVMILACALSAASFTAGCVVVAAAASIVLRIHTEERLLSDSATYRHYRGDVRTRMIPCLW